MKNTRTILAVAVAVAFLAGAQAAPDETRTFEITVEGDDGVPRSGHATAKLAKVEGETATYTLVRAVEGPSSTYSKGRAIVNTRTRAVKVELDSPVATGLVGALGGAATATKPLPVKVQLVPSRPSEYEFVAVWKAGDRTFHETWRELTRLTSNIQIHAPGESGSFGPDVTFDATVSQADHVVYFVDQYPVARFTTPGRHAVTKRLWQAGWRRFIVKAYGKAPAHGDAPLIGEAETVFLCRGLKLTPTHGAHVHKERVRVEAIPIGIDAKTIELRLDGKFVLYVRSAPWGADVSLGQDGEHRIDAIAYGPDGKERARTHSVIQLATGVDHTKVDLPAPPTHSTNLPELKGAPLIAHDPANPRNYRNVKARHVDRIVIHKAEGSLDGTVSWFKNPRSRVSAHYTVNASKVVQSVDDVDICWHTGNRAYNNRSIGIENAGFTNKRDTSEAHYRKLAKLVAWLCKKHGIPLDRKHVIGHNEVPNPSWPRHGPHWGGSGGHTDPGPYFDWNKLMTYARQASP